MKQGTKVTEKKYSWVVFLRVTKSYNGKDIKRYGTGTLISHGNFCNKFILTSAQLLMNSRKIEASIDCTLTSRWTRFIEVKDWLPNDQYSSSNSPHHIALIMLNPWQFMTNVAIKLPDKEYNPQGIYKTVGWNSVGLPFDGVRQLTETDVIKIDAHQRNAVGIVLDKYDIFLGKYANGVYTDEDSGAPLMSIEEYNSPIIFGIAVASGYGTHHCFVKIQPYLQWIENTLHKFSNEFPYRFSHNV